MKIQYNAYELLERMLNRDSWSQDEACWLFLGFAETKNGLYDLISGAKLVEHDSKKAWDDFSDLKHRWNATRFDSRFAHSLDQHDKYYCLAWAQNHGVEAPFAELLAWGEEKKLLHQERLQGVSSQIKGSLDTSDKVSVSDRELTNRLRLIGVLLEILTDEQKKQHFTSQNDLIGYITSHFSDRGLSEATLKRVFAQAKKVSH